MSVSVQFVGSITPSRVEEIRSVIEAISPKGRDRWDVTIAAERERLVVTLAGPDYHRRRYEIHGAQSHSPVYLAALARAEINAFPSCPPADFIFAMAELACLGVPYDDTYMFSGRVLVNGDSFSVAALANLYRDDRLEARFGKH